MASTIVGPAKWSMTRNKDGHRTYKLTNKVKVSDVGGVNALGDGPFIVLGTSGLPAVGSTWAYGNDADPFAYCTAEIMIKPHPGYKDEKATYWITENTFSSNPQSSCTEDSFDDPLLEPQKLSGTFLRSSQEGFTNKDGNLIQTSSHEFFRGSEVDFDVMMPSVHIEQNVADLELATVTSMISPRPSVNSAIMWGLPVRTVKLSGFAWAQVFYGTCDFYYTRAFDFEIDYGTWDRTLVDKGTKALFGQWAETDDCATSEWVLAEICGETPDPSNPSHFIRFKDRQGENAEVILNGAGLPYQPEDTGTSGAGTAGSVLFDYYPGADLFDLNVPTTIDP
tara:strand:+ start:4531 stop:5541 length:1011 start_codon:yes stop_codon:yes gene_type:complete